MVGEILKIKNCIPPLAASVLPRARITERLESFLTAEDSFTRQLTLVTAPAGFGKTTAVRSWLKGREKQTAWLSLDEEDNEPERFWTYFLSALQNLGGNIGRGPMEMLRSGDILSDYSSSFNQILTPLLNELFSIDPPSFLVLDDYHLINDRGIHKDLAFFIENLPPTLHLVITTRSDPPWPLSNWRAKQNMVEIRMDYLKFTGEEAAQYFETHNGPDLNEMQLDALYKKTEGWITGLQLAALSLSASQDVDKFINSFTGSHRHILLFLSEEVFNRQPDEIREFLIKTSVLNRLSASLCNAVTERRDSVRVLEALESENIFLIPLDEEGTWYRYHPLFTDLLQHLLKENYPGAHKELHEKAGKWFLGAGDAGEAVRHILTAGNQLEAGRILHENYGQILLSAGPGLLSRSLKAITEDCLKKFPRLVAHMTLFKLIENGREEAESYLEDAENLRYEDDVEHKEYRGILNAVKAYVMIYTYNFSGAVEHAQKALELLPPNNYYWRMSVAIYLGDAALFAGNPKTAYPYYLEAHLNNHKTDNRILILTSNFKIATCLYYLGKIDEAEELVQSTLTKATKKGLSGIPRTGLLWTLLGEIQREKGKLAEAERCVERGLLYSEPEKPCLGWNYIFKIALTFSQQDFKQAFEVIREVELLNSEVQLPQFVNAAVEKWKCRLLLECGEAGKALEILSSSGIHINSEIKGGYEWRHLVLARILINQDPPDLTNSARILDLVEQQSLAGGYNRLYLETLLVKAMHAEAKGEAAEADAILIKALTLGLKLGFFQIFRDSADALGDLFARIASNKKHSEIKQNLPLLDYVNKILPASEGAASFFQTAGEAAFKQVEQDRFASFDLIENLTNRELEILELIKEGLSNEAIAKKLYLSLGTVKWHTTNIYGKLGVRRRTAAVAVARKLKLIS